MLQYVILHLVDHLWHFEKDFLLDEVGQHASRVARDANANLGAALRVRLDVHDHFGADDNVTPEDVLEFFLKFFIPSRALDVAKLTLVFAPLLPVVHVDN